MKKIAFAGALLASVLLAACDERPAPSPAYNVSVEADNAVFIDPAPYPGDRK